MSLRIIEIPANPIGMPEGTWIEWSSLRVWLLDNAQTEIVSLISNGFEQPAATIEHTVTGRRV